MILASSTSTDTQKTLTQLKKKFSSSKSYMKLEKCPNIEILGYQLHEDNMKKLWILKLPHPEKERMRRSRNACPVRRPSPSPRPCSHNTCQLPLSYCLPYFTYIWTATAASLLQLYYYLWTCMQKQLPVATVALG